MARRKKKLSPIYVVSLAAHVAVGAALAFVPRDQLREVVAIAMQEAPKQDKKPEPPKPPPRADEPQAPRRAARGPRSASAPQPSAAGPQSAAFTDLGLTLDSNSSDGLAVNIAPPTAARPAAVAAIATVVKPKVLVAKKSEPDCLDALVKPRPLAIVRPSYTDEARRARVEGRVRVELAIDEHGAVTSARVLDGLGHGLDEAALAAAKNLQFAAATHCGRPVASPFVIAMRFVLGT